MLLGKGLIVKGLLGCLTLVTGACGIYYTHEHFRGQTTKFDKALIEYLRRGGKIKFAVKEGNNTIGNNFPNFTSANQKITATIKVKVSTTQSNEVDDGKLEDKAEAREGDGAKTETLRKLLGSNGEDWIWICEISFNKKEEDNSINELAEKEHLVKETTGFFNKLNNQSENHNDIKTKFIKNCAKARGEEKNKTINGGTLSGTPKEIKTEKTFELVKGETNKKDRNEKTQEETKLYFEKDEEFKRWFL